MLAAALGVDAKQLAIFSRGAQKGNERSKVHCAQISGAADRVIKHRLTNGNHGVPTQLWLDCRRLSLITTHSQWKRCEMNEWGKRTSEEGEEMDGRSEGKRKGKKEQLVQMKSGDWCVFALGFLQFTSLHLFEGAFCVFDIRLGDGGAMLSKHLSYPTTKCLISSEA